ncbi:MAG TPA: hypothetical protein VLH85_00770 [Levilinea sp.]|nr:hypothetical protein [Levilinea sp.]
MANLGLPELFAIVFIVLILLGAPAFAVILVLALRRAAGNPSTVSAAAEVQTQPAQALVHAAAKIRVDGSAVFSAGGLRAERIERGVFHLLFDGFSPGRQYLVRCTPLATLAGEGPVSAEVLGGEVRSRFEAGGASEEGVILWLRQPDHSLTDREFMVEITEVP